ncbi:hypothetical protein, partial [Streptomyces sp. NPDC088183]|uniref:hypothetical protein n=1 Tax=Streptomyces sp. NPDC088183 TaxID=3160992 RepID=UPI00341B1F32
CPRRCHQRVAVTPGRHTAGSTFHVSGRSLPQNQQVALHFGLAVPEDTEGLSDVIAADTEHAHRFWRGK